MTRSWTVTTTVERILSTNSRNDGYYFYIFRRVPSFILKQSVGYNKGILYETAENKIE